MQADLQELGLPGAAPAVRLGIRLLLPASDVQPALAALAASTQPPDESTYDELPLLQLLMRLTGREGFDYGREGFDYVRDRVDAASLEVMLRALGSGHSAPFLPWRSDIPVLAHLALTLLARTYADAPRWELATAQDFYD